MSAALADFTTGVTASGTSVTANKPANTADGDILLAWVCSSGGTGGLTPPSGWTQSLALTSRKGGLYWKPLPSAVSESATNYTMSGGVAGSRFAMNIIRLTGVSVSTWVDAISAAETAGTSGVVSIGAVSPTGSADLCLAFVFANPGSNNTGATLSFTTPGWANTGIKAEAPNTANSAATVVGIGYKQLTAAGSTGTVNVSGVGTPIGGNATPNGILLAIAPAAVSPSDTANLSSSGTLSAAASPATSAAAGLAGSGTLTASGAGVGAGAATLTGAGTLATTGSGLTAVGTATLTGTGGLSATPRPGTITAAVLSGTGALTASKTTDVQRCLASIPDVAHRGGSMSWVEETADAYARAFAWNPNLVLEMSVWRCSTGQLVLSHDRTTQRMFGDAQNYDIPTTPWSTLSTIRTTVGNFPLALFTDMLDLYASKRIIVVDNKQDNNTSAFLDLLDSYGGKDRFIIKALWNATATITAAHARGYVGWGYLYNTDIDPTVSPFTGSTANLNAAIATWDILGLNYGDVATQANWNTFVAACQAAGKPWWPHILNTSTARATADTKATNAGGTNSGYMISDVVDLVPHAPADTLSFSGAGTLTATPVPRQAAGATFAGSGTLTAAAGITVVTATAGFTGTGQIGASATPKPNGSAAFTGAGTLAGVGAGGSGVVVALSGTGSLTASVTPRPSGVAALTGTGQLATGATPRAGASASLTGAGTLTASAYTSVADATALTGVGALTAVGTIPQPNRDLTLTYTNGTDRWTATVTRDRWTATAGTDRWTSSIGAP